MKAQEIPQTPDEYPAGPEENPDDINPLEPEPSNQPEPEPTDEPEAP